METLTLIVYFFLGATLSANWKKIRQHLPFLSNFSKQTVTQIRRLDKGKESAAILDLLAHHKDGLTLKEIANELGVHYIKLAKTTQSLLKNNQIEKRGNRYFIG